MAGVAGHGLWLDPDYKHPFYFMQGHLGQYTLVVPSKDVVVVRLGQSRNKTYQKNPNILDEVYRYVDEAVQMHANAKTVAGADKMPAVKK